MPDTFQPTDPTPKEKLYKTLVDQGYYTKSFADFNKQYSTPESIDKIYSVVSGDGLYTKSKDEFFGQYFGDVKKKDVGGAASGPVVPSGAKPTASSSAPPSLSADEISRVKDFVTGKSQEQRSAEKAPQKLVLPAGLTAARPTKKLTDTEVASHAKDTFKDPLFQVWLHNADDPVGQLRAKAAKPLPSDINDYEHTEINNANRRAVNGHVADVVANGLFEGGHDAAQYLKKRGVGEGAPRPLTETEKVAVGKVEAAQKANDLLNQYSLPEAALRASHPDLEGKAFEQFKRENNAQAGQAYAAFIQNPDVQERAKHDPKLRLQLLRAENTLTQDFPDFTSAQIAGKISQKLEDAGEMSALSNNPTKAQADWAVAELEKEGKLSPQEKQLYEKTLVPRIQTATSWTNELARGIPFANVFADENPIKSRGVFENALESFRNTLKGGAKTAEEATVAPALSLFSKNGLTDYHNQGVNEQLSQTPFEPKGLGKYTTTFGNIAGMVVPTILGAGGLKAAGASETVANGLSFALSTAGQHQADARERFKGDPAMQPVYTAVMSTLDYALGGGLSKAFSKGAGALIKDDVASAIKGYTTGELSGAAASDLVKTSLLKNGFDFAKETASHNLKGAGMMAAPVLVDAALQNAFGDHPPQFSDAVKQAVEHAQVGFWASTPLSAVAALGSRANKMNARLLYEQASRPAFREEMLAAGATPEQLKNYDAAQKILKELRQSDVATKDLPQLLLHDLNQKVLAGKASETESPTLKARIKEQIALSKEKAQTILNRQDVNLRPQDVEGKKTASVVRPEENRVPETVTISPKENSPEEKRGAKVILPQSNKAPEIIEHGQNRTGETVGEPLGEAQTKANEGTETTTPESLVGTGQAGTEGTTPVLESERGVGEAKGEEITLYHGTPHEVDSFSLDKVGTGEGNGAFGHGLYFTDIKEIADHYAEKLGKETKSEKRNVYEVLVKGKDKLDWMSWKDDLTDAQKEKVKPLIYALIKEKNLPPHYEHIITQPVGFLYKHIAELLGSKKAASEFFLKAGIDGIKYPTDSLGDMANRYKKGFNYVVFDDKAIEIRRPELKQKPNETSLQTESPLPANESTPENSGGANESSGEKATVHESRTGQKSEQTKAEAVNPAEGKPTPAPKPKSEGGGGGGNDLDGMAAEIPNYGQLSEYASKGTIEKYHGETPENDQSIIVQQLKPALEHGEKIIEKAKEIFGDDYAAKTLDYIEGANVPVQSKALMYISLENALMREKRANPESLDIQKKQDMVRAKSQAFLRQASLAINFGKLRRIGEVGFDLSKVTDNFFSSKEREAKTTVEKTLQASADDINKAAEEKAAQEDGATLSVDVEQAIQDGVKAEMEKLYKALPKERQRLADKAIAALENIQKKLRNKQYSDVTGMVAIVDAGITTIKHAIKAGVAIADAVELGIKKIKEKLGKEWEKEDEFRRDMLDGFRAEGVATEKKARPAPSMETRLEKAKDLLRQKIEDVQRELDTKKRNHKADKTPLAKDVEYTELAHEYKTLLAERDALFNLKEEKAVKATETRLKNEIADLDRQIQKGEKDAKEKKAEVSTPEIERLRKERDQKIAILNELDPEPKAIVRDALLKAGFGRETIVKTKEGKKTIKVIDWKKLAGEEGSIEKIKATVEKYLGNTHTPEQVARMQQGLIEEYNNLRASVIEKAQNELAKRNQKTVTLEQKSAARKLAELYNYGLFDRDPSQYDVLLAKAIGMDKLSPERFRQAHELARAMEAMYSTTFNDKKLNDTALRTMVQTLEEKIRWVLHQEALQHGSTFLRIVDYARTWMDTAQRMILNSLKQAAENPLSGLEQLTISNIDNVIDGGTSPELARRNSRLAKAVYKDMVLHGAVGYGDVNTVFVSKGNLEMYINKLSDNEVYHGVMSTLIGRTTLDAADSFYKAKLTEQKFVHNLLKVLQTRRLVEGKLVEGMSREEAVRYVSEKLTGQSFEAAKETAQNIIKKVNSNGRIVGDSPAFVERLANDIVKAALVHGEKIAEEQVTAAYNAAYKSAGQNLGHEANNFVSRAVQGTSAKIEKEIDDAIKEKKYNKAAMLTLGSVFFRNVANPFVAGGTNWMVLKLEKNGLGLLTGLGSWIGNHKIDIATESGQKYLERALYEEAKARDKFLRGAVGGATAVLLAATWYGVTNTDEFRRWRGRNKWAAKYTDLITPEAVLADIAARDGKLGNYAGNLLGHNDAFDKVRPLIMAGNSFAKGKTEEAWGKLGEAVGSIFGVPVPWRLVRDGQAIWLGLKGEAQPLPPQPSKSFWSGALKAGFVDYLGLRPKDDESGTGPGKPHKAHKATKPHR